MRFKLISTLVTCTWGLGLSTDSLGLGNQAKLTPVEQMSKAAAKGDIVTIRRLLKSRVNPNEAPEYESPLALAAENGRIEIARMLIGHGAKVDLDSPSGSALLSAAEGGHLGVLQLLLDHGAKVNRAFRFGSALTVASRKGNWEMIRLLLDRGANPNLGDYHGQRPLGFAVRHGRLDWVQRLIKAGAEVEYGEKWNWSPLLSAAEIGNVEIIRVLLDHGCHLDELESLRGDTALSTAVRNHRYAAVKYLIQRGANVNPALHANEDDPDFGLDTPLAIARAHGDWRMVDILESAGGKYINLSYDYNSLIHTRRTVANIGDHARYCHGSQNLCQTDQV